MTSDSKKEKIVVCRDIGEAGEGIGKPEDGKTCFVPGLLPGETAEVAITHSSASWSRARISGIITTSPGRCTPRCGIFGTCGGCQIQHLDYTYQVRFKTEKVRNCLIKIGRIQNPSVQDCLPSAEPYGYRNKLTLPVQGTSSSPVIGFYKPDSHHAVPLAHCPVAAFPHQPILDAVRNVITSGKIPIYQEGKRKGLLRHLILRYSETENKILAVAVFTKWDSVFAARIADALAPFENVKGIVININNTPGNVILGKKYIPVRGDCFLSESILGIPSVIRAGSFSQLNTRQAALLYRTTLDCITRDVHSNRDEKITELFCGSGIISFLAAKKFKKITGIENSPESVETARETASQLGLDNTEFICTDAAAGFKNQLQNGTMGKYLIVNPPRKGLSEDLINSIGESNVKKMVYISCKPSTLARDAALLIEKGFQHGLIQPVDMFPQTTHVETVMEFYR